MRPGFDYIGVNVGFFCHDGGGRVLLHKRSDKCRDEHHMWDAGGGGVEHGETLEDAVRREILEEYGCEVIAMTHLTQMELFREHDGVRTHWLANIYVAQVNPDEVRVMEVEKNLGNEWFSLHEFPDPLHSVARRCLDEHKIRLAQLINGR